jgi:integrase/recombinase XerD
MQAIKNALIDAHNSEDLNDFIDFCNSECSLSLNTVAAYKTDLQCCIMFLRTLGVAIRNANKDNIKRYLEKLYNDGIKKTSYCRKISSLNKFFYFLLSEKRIPVNPLIDIKRPKDSIKLPKFLTEEEVALLISTAAKGDDKFAIRLTCIITMLLSTGLRISELLDLKLSQVLLAIQSSDNEKFISVIGKGNKERMVPLSHDAVAAIKNYLEVRTSFIANSGNNYLFCSRSSKGRLTREQVGMLLKKLSLSANINPDRVSPHVIRHTFATRFCNNKIDLRIIQELLGHSDISTTEIYINSLDMDVVDFVNKYHPLSSDK